MAMEALVVGEVLVDFSEFEEFEVNFYSPSNAALISTKSSINHETIDSDEYLSTFIEKCKIFIDNSKSAFTTEQLVREILKVTQQTSSDIENDLYNLIGDSGIELLMEIVEKKDQIRVLTDENLKFYFNEGVKEVKLPANQQKKVVKREKISNSQGRKDHSNQPAIDPSLLWLNKLGFDESYLYEESLLGLHGGASSNSIDAVLNKWTENLLPAGSIEVHEKYGLPSNSERKVGQGWEEIHLPAPKKLDKSSPNSLVHIETLEPWAQLAFPSTKALNRIQSEVFEVAYNSSENMLICAPTGAGKTNIAMLAFLQLVKSHIIEGVLDKDAVKCVYIAPMKALVQEIVTKFSERLDPLGMIVREFTGDMQLNRSEILETNLLVTTPEKYDVVTRKGGDGSLGTIVNLIIIDEIHLLADDRGAVIETIVSRTQRYIESSQKFIRLVGLSATLPNYKDVARFLHVSASHGLFYFGPEYRPVPLDQTFIGVTEKNRHKRNDMMNRTAHEQMVKALERGKQVMIFVHSRKETSKTMDAIRDLSGYDGTFSLLSNAHHEKYTIWKREVDKSKSKEVQQLFYQGLGVHHAGMLRADRTLTEQLFEQGLVKVLCCTATLAWGVNLPAHTVIIKGTELYDPERGGFVDLSILDVLQIFGRAGRPQYDSTGHAILITPHNSLGTYLSMMGHQAPIESHFIKALADHMNAEIVNGTINNIKEASTWLAYTFLFIRMSKNPLVYGMKREELYDDPTLDRKRVELVTCAAEALDTAMMIRYDKRTGNLAVTDLGRVASHYYIKYETIEAFNNMLSAHLTHHDALHVLCSSAEFDQLKVRPEELEEIDELKKINGIIHLKSGAEETSGKVNILLHSYINNSRVNSFTLQSDINYVAQNAGRITRALFEICLKRGWSTLASHYLELAKCIDRKMTMEQSPLRQFHDEIPPNAIRRCEESGIKLHQLLDMSPREVGEFCHSCKHGQKIKSFIRKLPIVEMRTLVQPLTRGILRLCVTLHLLESFEWTDRYHGFAQGFWIWIEDGENEYIYHSEYILIHKKQAHIEQIIEFTIPIREPLPPQYYVRCISDYWVGCENTIAVSFQHLILPDRMPPHTELLDMHPVPVTALQHKEFEHLYSYFSHFNPIQSQVFHTLYYTDHNILVGAPTGSGKTITGELALLRLLKFRPGAKCIYVAPLKALARERLLDWKKKFGNTLGLSIMELTGDITPDLSALKAADVLIVTPEKWDSISRGWQRREYVHKVELVIIDEIHLLGEERGPVLEVIVSRMRFIAAQTAHPIRFVGLSTALANPRDLADWLGIKEVGVYNFRPSVRPIPMTIHIQGFPGKHYCPRMATMNKPAYAAILEHSPLKPVLIFVSSRRQTRLTALDLISYCASDDNPKQFLHMPEDEVIAHASTIRDSALRNTLEFGIGIHHAGLDNHDRAVVEELFLACKIQVLVCTATLAWGVNLPCHLVIIKGTEFFDGKIGKYVDSPVTDVLQMMGRAGRPQFDTTGIACVFVHEPKKTFYRKFLHEPFPVESSLAKQLHNHFNAEIANNTLHNLRDCIEYLTWTYYFRRLLVNPSYYGLDGALSPEKVEQHLHALSTSVLAELQSANCIEVVDDTAQTVDVKSLTDSAHTQLQLAPTVLGRVASYYYLHYKTVAYFAREFPAVQQELSGVDINLTFGKLLRLLCHALEFSELPVRHNEDLLNAQLSIALVAKLDQIDPTLAGSFGYINALDMSSPHTKTILLLLASMTKAQLPISDYAIDSKLVFDQLPRVLNALIDIVASDGHVHLVLALTRLYQMIMQRVIGPECELLQLPGVDADVCNKLTKQFRVSSLKDLLAKKKQFVKSNFNDEFINYINSFPDYQLRVKIRGHSETIPVDTEITIIVDAMKIEGGGYKGSSSSIKDGKKQEKESYWLILASRTNNELVAIKRINRVHSSLSITFISAEKAGTIEEFDLYLINDSMVGLDYNGSIQTLTTL